MKENKKHIISYSMRPKRSGKTGDRACSRIVKLDRNSQSDWLIQGLSKAVLDQEKAYWTESVMTTTSLQFWKYLCREF